MIRRHTPLRSHVAIRRKVRIAPRNAKRKAREFRRTYGGSERAEFVKSLDCAVTWHFHEPLGVSTSRFACGCAGAIQNCHIITGGTSRKADAALVVPLCWAHHQELHQGRDTFERTYGVDLDALAAETERLWQEQTRGCA